MRNNIVMPHNKGVAIKFRKCSLRFSCKEKLPQDPKDENDIPKGIVKWLVEMLDGTEEPIVGVATILTMVAKANLKI